MHNSGVVLVHPQDEHDRMQADCQHACACEAQDLRLLLMKRWLSFGASLCRLNPRSSRPGLL